MSEERKTIYLCLAHMGGAGLVIDDLMNIIVGHDEGNQLFSFINSNFE